MKRDAEQDDDEQGDDELPALMTTREVAAVARMAPESVRNRVHRGQDPQPVKRGAGRMLFRREDVRRWLLGGSKIGRPQGRGRST